MAAPTAPSRSSVIPCMRYRDARAAIDWLCTAFGFERHAVYADDTDGIAHAELVLGNGMVMLGSVGPQPSAWGRLIRQPDELGGAETQSAYLVVADPDTLYHRARSAGARMLLDIQDEEHGGRGFTCADPEGHIWSFGSYDPWQTPNAS
jgi:uncharacterized glyoxalase superfamily protein PhnB